MKFVQASLALATALPVLFCSCAGSGGAESADADKPAEQATPKLVGRIASIQSNPRFVLIQSYGPWQVPADTVLTTQGLEGRTANLLATGESAGQYAAADIRAGEVEVGDAVYSLPDPRPEPLFETAAAAAPGIEDQEPAPPESGETDF